MWLTKFLKYQHNTRLTPNGIEIFWEWQGDVIDAVEELANADRSDAQGIVEAQFDTLTKGWDDYLPAKDVAKLIIENSKP